MRNLLIKRILLIILMVSSIVMKPCLISAVKAIGKVKDARLLMHRFDKITTEKIRIYQTTGGGSSKKPNLMRVGEIEVYYVPGKEKDYIDIRYYSYSKCTNIALRSRGCSLRVDGSSLGYKPERINDGIKGVYLNGGTKTIWVSAETTGAHWVELVFPKSETANVIAIFCEEFPKNYKIEFWENERWEDVRNLQTVEEPAPYIWSFNEWEVIRSPESELSNLLVLQTERGPKFIKSVEMWSQKEQQIRSKILDILGPFPSSRGDLNPKVVKEREFEEYTRKKIVFISEPGDTIPAYLLVPKNLSKPTPAIIALHQTIQLGKKEPVGIEGKSSLAYGLHLVKRGYVVLAFDQICFGERHSIRANHYGDAIKFYLNHPRWSVMGKMIWDVKIAIDYLQTLNFVDKQRIGCIGHSHGGYGTIFATAFDERIKVAVSNCGFTTFRADGRTYRWAMATALMPKLGFYDNNIEMVPFDFHEVISLIAPRPFLIIAPQKDAGWKIDGVNEAYDRAMEVYKLLGADEKLKKYSPNCGHEFPLELREKAYNWFDKWFQSLGGN